MASKKLPLDQRLLLTPSEAIALLGLGKTAFYDARRRGDLDLPTVLLNGREYYPREAVEKWVEENAAVRPRRGPGRPPKNGRAAA